MVFFCLFSIFFPLFFLLILAGVRYDTARSLSQGWAGLPNHPSPILQQSQAVEGPGLGPSRSWSRAFRLAPQPNLYLYKASPTCIICKDTKRMIVRPASSLVVFYFLRISRNGFEGRLCKCNLCVTVYSFVLCGKTLRSLNCDLKHFAAVK